MVEIKLKLNNLKKVENQIVKKTRKIFLLFWANFIWYIHLAIVLIALGLFFIPLNYLPNKIIWHFYFLWSIIFFQITAGLIYLNKTKSFQFVCPLTAIEKHLVKKHPHKHVGESCIGDFCAERIGLPKWISTICVIIALTLVTLQYFKTI